MNRIVRCCVVAAAAGCVALGLVPEVTFAGPWARSTLSGDTVPSLRPPVAALLRIVEGRLGGSAAAWSDTLPPLPGATRDSSGASQQGSPPTLSSLFAAAGLPDAWAEHADLAVQVRGRAELGGAWTRTYPCSAVTSLRCGRGGIPRIQPDFHVQALAQGMVLDRFRVDVDYDQAREFDASNQVRVSYAGQPGEVLRTLQIGNVAFSLPPSRLFGGVMPGGAFGVQATGGVGRMQLQALWAQSRIESSVLEFKQGSGGGGVSREVRVAIDDADYVRGQFFFLFDPSQITGFPHLDIRTLGAGSAPPARIPGAGIEVFRYRAGPPPQDGSTVTLRAVPEQSSQAGEAVTGAFRRLHPGRDYQLHPSGTWLALAAPLAEDEALAVAYRALSGAWVGDAPESQAMRTVRLLKGTRATHRPGASTWDLEMHQVYRVPGAVDVSPGSLDLVISRGDIAAGDLYRPDPANGSAVSFLQLFGLDDEASGRIDAIRVYRPNSESVDSVVPGVFVVFPTLHPFAEPPPSPPLGNSAAAAARVLGAAGAPAIYDGVDDRARREGKRFRLNFAFTARAQGMGSAIMLGTAGLREGSERVYLGSRQLERGIDYEIQYDLGEIRLNNPALLTTGRGDLRVTFEQNPLFRRPPNTVAGLGAIFPLGSAGELNFIALSRAERSVVRRPALGYEPASILLAGVSGRTSVELPRGHGGNTAKARNGPRVVVSGEAVVSRPQRGGSAYLDDFEQGGEVVVPLTRTAWHLGSAPASRRGAETLFPSDLSRGSVGTLVWQHDFREAGGRISGSLRTVEVDTLVRSTGRSLASNVLYLTLAGGASTPIWRSVTTPLSPTGADLRDYEFLEFYVRGGDRNGEALVLDIGSVNEDALAVNARGEDEGTDASSRSWGRGVLDQEWDPGHESWTSAAHDGTGLWDGSCQATPGETYPLGDPRANCTRGNGIPDSEDLDGNATLDTEERVFRTGVDLSDTNSPFLVRGTTQTGTAFRMYRIPLRRATAVGATTAELGFIKHLRLTVVGRDGSSLALARVRIVGARWRKRNASGVVRGLAAFDTVDPGGMLEVGPVGRLTESGGYVSPPGVGDQRQNRSDDFGGLGGSEFNEKALALSYSNLPGQSRAEVALPFNERPRNLLGYREMRFWVAATRGEPGADVLLRAGTSPDNAYLYRHRITRVGRPALPSDWTEVVVELKRWTALRTRAEEALRRTDRRGDAPVVVWDADSTYAVVVSDRGRAPNLASLREVAFAVWNGGSIARTGEVWINDVRLSGAAEQTAAAAHVSVSLENTSGVTAELSYATQTGYFVQGGGTPTFQGESALTLTTGWELGRVLPARWRIEAPVSFSYQAAGSAPVLVAQTDMPAENFEALRKPRMGTMHALMELGMRPGTSGAPEGVLAPLRLKVGYESGDAIALYQTERHTNLAVAAQYQLRPRARAFQILPNSFMPGGGMLGVLGRTRAFQGLMGARFRLNPTAITWSTEYGDGSDQRAQYEQFDITGDSVTATQHVVRRGMTHDLGIALRPFASVEVDVNGRWERNLLPSLEQNALAERTIEGQRWRPAGLDMGRLGRRVVSTRFAWNPVLASWFTTQWSSTANFATDADPSYLRTAVVDRDTTRSVARNLQARRTVALRSTLDPALFATVLGMHASGEPGFIGRGVRSVLGSLAPVEAEWSHTLQSRFDRTDAQRGIASELGLSGSDALRVLGQDTADESSDLSHVALRTRLDLPWALGLGIGYESSKTQFGGSRGARLADDVAWPGLQLRWSGLPLGGLTRWLMTNASVDAGYTRRRIRASYGSATNRDGSDEVAFPLTVATSLKGGLNLAYRLESKSSVDEALSGRTRRADATHALSLAGSLRPGALFEPVLRDPISVTLGITQAYRQGCRPVPPETGCSADTRFTQERERVLRLQLDTRVRSLRVGLQGDFSERRSLIGERSGFGQFGLGLFAEYELNAGQVPQQPSGPPSSE